MTTMAKGGAVAADSEHFDIEEMLQTPLSRRQFLVRGAVVLAVPSVAGSVLAACGGSSSGPATSASPSSPANPVGTAVISNFPGWIGPTEVADFHKRYPQARVHMNTSMPSTIAGTVELIKNSPGAYDGALGDIPTLGQMQAAGVYQKPDWSAVPNLANVDAVYRRAYPDAFPNDYGFSVIGYRKDIVSKPPSSWADFWKLASTDYSGRVTMEDLDRPTLGVALKYLGYSANTRSAAELNSASEALIRLKPHLLALQSVNVSTDLAKGVIAMAHCYNYDVAVAQQSSDKVAWLVPEEGTVGYIEGFVPIKGSEQLDVVYAFLDFHLEPKVYATFVNATGSSWVMSDAEPYLDAGLRRSAPLKPTAAQLAKIEWTEFLGEATALWAAAWQKFKAA
jgi:spermidine/putrescine transport system substrate-binding protein